MVPTSGSSASGAWSWRPSKGSLARGSSERRHGGDGDDDVRLCEPDEREPEQAHRARRVHQQCRCWLHGLLWGYADRTGGERIHRAAARVHGPRRMKRSLGRVARVARRRPIPRPIPYQDLVAGVDSLGREHVDGAVLFHLLRVPCVALRAGASRVGDTQQPPFTPSVQDSLRIACGEGVRRVGGLPLTVSVV